MAAEELAADRFSYVVATLYASSFAGLMGGAVRDYLRDPARIVGYLQARQPSDARFVGPVCLFLSRWGAAQATPLQTVRDVGRSVLHPSLVGDGLLEEEVVRRTMADIGLSAIPATSVDRADVRRGRFGLAHTATRSGRTPVTDTPARGGACRRLCPCCTQGVGSLVGSAPSPFLSRPTPLARWAMRAYSALAEADASASASKSSTTDHVAAPAATDSP